MNNNLDESKTYYEQGIMPTDLLDESFAEKVEIEIPVRNTTGIKFCITMPRNAESLAPQVREKKEIVYVLPNSFTENNNIFKMSKISQRAAAILIDAMSQLEIIARFSTESQAKLINWIFGYGKRSAEKLISNELRYIMEHSNNKPSTATLEEVDACIGEVIAYLEMNTDTEEGILSDLGARLALICERINTENAHHETLVALKRLQDFNQKNIDRIQTKINLAQHHK